MSELPPAKKPRGDWGEGPLYLAFDVSTQSCKALVIDRSLAVAGVSRVHFDTDLPHYRTHDGCHRGEGGRVTSPTIMWVEAMELALQRLKAQGCPFDRIAAVSGSGQQHGSVYWTTAGVDALRGLDPSKGSARDQLGNAFAVENSPIWMDTSTTASCQELSERYGGALRVADWTGSTAQERFSGHHFKRFIADRGLAGVGALSLVSSLGASLLAGDIVPIDISDAAGMNLMDIRSKSWHTNLLEFVAPGQVQELRRVLAEPGDSWAVCGLVHRFWEQRYGFPAACKVITWSGDNPCAVVGSGLMREGDIAISLGTSDTVLSVIPRVPDVPLAFGHIFPHPVLKDRYWSMLCYTNGDVTRRKVRDEFFATCGDDWGEFSKAIRETPPGNDGSLGMFFTTDEITPPISNGPDFRARGNATKIELVDEFGDPKHNARAVIEMRALAIKIHLQKLMPRLLHGSGDGSSPHLLLTGGASSNPDILKVFADVFQRPVRSMDNAEGAAFGAAVRALHAADPEAAEGLSARLLALTTLRAEPSGDPGAAEACNQAAAAFAELEAKALKARGRL